MAAAGDKTTGYDVLIVVLPATAVLLAGIAVPPITHWLARRRERAAERVAAVVAFAAVVRSTRVAIDRNWMGQHLSGESNANTAVTPDRFTVVRELHQAEARLALAVPEAADKARAITADLVVASTGEAARDTPKLDEDLAVLVKLVY